MADYRLTQSGDQVQSILNNAAMQEALATETTRAEEAEQQLQTNINAEAGARQQADTTLQGNIDTEEARAKAAEQLNADGIDAIEAKIPATASDENQLVDEQKMNSSIATATATYRGAFNLVTDLHLTVSATQADIINALAATISGADNNDYCFVQIPVANDRPTEYARIERYKYNGTVWAFEYALNNSGFTADQWNAINSGITSGLVAKLSALPSAADLTALFANIYTKSETNGVVAAETQRAQAAEQTNAADIDTIEGKIPSDASAQNKLASEQYVNSSVATNTATFKGAYNLVTDLSLTTAATRDQIAAALAGAITQADNNDYAFVQIPTADATPTEIASVERYKFNGVVWAFEYELNNSGFTSAQWNALNSGITSGLVTKLTALPTNAELTTLLAGKQATIVDLDAIRSGAQAGAVSAPQATTYTKTEVDGMVGDEQSRAQAAEQANADDIDAIEAKIPAAASAQNKLATEQYVNSSVATNTATYRGSYNLVSDLSLTTAASEEQIATALAGEIDTADNNDYCFVQIPVADATPTVIARVDRYKFDGTAWGFEFSLNNSGFTAAQWDALNSGITSGLVGKLSDLPTEAELSALLLGKQDVISDLAAIRSGAALGATAYQKPITGIPETDLTTELQLALASFITASAQNLAYYYLKSETYSAAQIDAMIAAIKQFTFESVQTLPEASAQTVGKIYLVPSAQPQTHNVKDEYITLTATEEGTTTYYWECIGSTEVNLTNYYTKTETDTAIASALNTALAAYSTTATVSTMISTAINSALQAYATKEYVASQVQEYAGTFRGTYNTLADLQATTGNHHNDYAWVKVTDTDGDNDYDRYKYNGTDWVFEYRLNNTHFTAAELSAIRSGITTAKREKLDNLPATASSSIAATTGDLTISGSKQFFVGTQGQDGRWTLESLTPAEMQKCAYAYLAGATVGTSPAHLQGTDASGNPQRITPSDLASLLGGVYNIGSFNQKTYFTENLNNAAEEGLNYYLVSSGNQNFPESSGEGILVTLFRGANAVGYQICYTQSKILYFRGIWGSSWTAWSRVDAFGCVTPVDLASLLGGGVDSAFWDYLGTFASTFTIDLANIGINTDCIGGTYILGYGGSTRCGRQGIVHFDVEGGGSIHWIEKPYQWDSNVTSMTISDAVLTLTCSNEWMRIGLRKL